MLPLLKSLICLTVLNPGTGKTNFSSEPNSAVELPPKSLIVPGRNLPPSCHRQAPFRFVVEKNG